MSKRHTPNTFYACEADRSRVGTPDDSGDAHLALDIFEPKVNLNFALFRKYGWYFLPHYYLRQPDSSYVIADWFRYALARITTAEYESICHPLLAISQEEPIPIFAPGEHAGTSSETFDLGLFAAKIHRLEVECRRRLYLSDFGNLAHPVWGQNWTWP